MTEDGQQRVNETEFVLTNIPDSIVLWTWGLGFAASNYFFKYTSLIPSPSDSWVGASAIEGTYNFERTLSCRFSNGAGAVLRVPFTMNWFVERFHQDPVSSGPTGSNVLIKDAERESLSVLWLDFIHDEPPPWGLPGDNLEHYVYEPPWYMHYVRTYLNGSGIGGSGVSNPIRPKQSDQATCGKSLLTWQSMPFYRAPYPYSPTIDFSAHSVTYAEENAYGPGSTAESFS